MKSVFNRAAMLALPLAAAAIFATSVVAAPNERTDGRDAGPKAEQNGGGGGDMQRSTRRGERMRGNADQSRSNGKKIVIQQGDDRARLDRANRGDRNVRRNSGGNGNDSNWRRGRRFNWGPGVAFYFNDGYYYGECNWLKRRARQTGNPIWLRRFQQCRNAA